MNNNELVSLIAEFIEVDCDEILIDVNVEDFELNRFLINLTDRVIRYKNVYAVGASDTIVIIHNNKDYVLHFTTDDLKHTLLSEGVFNINYEFKFKYRNDYISFVEKLSFNLNYDIVLNIENLYRCINKKYSSFSIDDMYFKCDTLFKILYDMIDCIEKAKVIKNVKIPSNQRNTYIEILNKVILILDKVQVDDVLCNHNYLFDCHDGNFGIKSNGEIIPLDILYKL